MSWVRSTCLVKRLLSPTQKALDKGSRAVPKAFQQVPRAVRGMVSSVFFFSDGKFSVSDCAKVTNKRIGEADLPGPRAPRGRGRPPRELPLDEVQLVTAQTERLQSQIWLRFEDWVTEGTSAAAAASLLVEPFVLCWLVAEFGRHLYADGESLYLFRHLILAMLKRSALARQHAHVCWNLVTKWELVEPLRHRSPLPEVLLKAMVAVAILWSWHRVAGILLLAFWGIARPGEALRGLRSDLLLPCDLLLAERLVCYLKIRAPKTGRRTKARVQHLSVHNPEVLPFLEKVFGRLKASEALYPGSPASFRKRWDALLQALLVPKDLLLTPGGLRGGGAIAAYHRNVDLSTLQWQMRIKHQVTLQAYIQEVAAENLLLQLPGESVARVKAAAALYSDLLLC